MYRRAELKLADGESKNASLMGAELFRRQQTSGLAYPLGRGRLVLPHRRHSPSPNSRFDGDSMGKNTAKSNMAGYQ